MGRPESESIRSIGIDVFCMLWKLKALLYPYLLPGISSKSGLSWRACKYSFRSEMTVSQHQINTELNASINLKLQHPPWHLNFCGLVRSNPVPGTKIVLEIPTRVPNLIVSFLRKRRDRDRGFLVDLFFRVNCSRKWTVCFRYPHIKR